MNIMSLIKKIIGKKETVVTKPLPFKPTVAIDFDGVIHSYTSGWKGADVIDDMPVNFVTNRAKHVYSSINWLTDLVLSGKLTVVIFSSRNNQKGGIEAMKQYLLDNGMSELILKKIKFPKKKPSAWLMIDDRAIQFKGVFVNAEQILAFKPWKMS